MRYEVSAIVHDSPERVWAWWTDYGPAGHKEQVDHGLAWSDRTVVARDGDTLELRESVLGVTVLRHRVELHPSRRAFRETSDAFEAWWTYQRCPDGTRVRREVQVTGRAAKLAPRGLTVWTAQKDLDHHVDEYERSHLR